MLGVNALSALSASGKDRQIERVHQRTAEAPNNEKRQGLTNPTNLLEELSTTQLEVT